MDANERLEVEDEDKRQCRIKNLLERTNAPSTKKRTSPSSPTTFAISPDEQRPHHIDPPSELLDRVRSFLPQIADSNTALSQQAQDDIDIENVGEDEERYIEMNLGLGVFEYRKQGADTSSEDSDSEQSSSESSDTSKSSNEISGAFSLSSRPIKPLPKRQRPEIVVMEDTSA